MRAVFDADSKNKRIKEIEKQMESPSFWTDKEKAQELSEELAHTKQELENISGILKEIAEIEEFVDYTDKEEEKIDEDLGKEISEKLKTLEKDISKEEIKTYFSGPYDGNNVMLTIYSGAGGIDAQDWAGMLLRMYQRYCESKNYKTALLSQYLGEEKGIKEATLEIAGKFAYGYLKNENGVHRLVRISPFSAQSLRHTSFALVEVLPQIEKGSSEEILIKPEDIEVQTFRSSGPGGQYVNKTESAVRVRHILSGIVVECQTGRLQGENKEQAMKLLKVKLLARKLKEEKEKIDKIRGGFVPAEWGNQIRSYVLHPYKMVKDHRTNVETASADSVLDGDLDEFVEAEVKGLTQED